MCLRPEGSFDAKIQFEVRKLTRPEIDYWNAIFNVIIPTFVCILISWWSVHFALVLLCFYTMFRMRKIVIWCVRAYQRFAPDHVRLSCVFEPSCSEYMILAIEKYGVIRGVAKGLKRLRRCRAPNGGEDYP